MSKRAETLAVSFERANTQLLSFVELLSNRQAEEQADCTRAEALDLLHRNSGYVAGRLRGLSDEHLGRTAISPRVRTVTIDDAVEHGLVAHLHGHFEALRETLQAVGIESS